MPSLVLLDLILPGMHGIDVLQWIRQQPALKDLRVVVMTSSRNLDLINHACELGAKGCLIKPMAFDLFSEFTRALGGHWLWLAEIPADLCRSPSSGTRPGSLSEITFDQRGRIPRITAI